jgi:hypothetical protein
MHRIPAGLPSGMPGIGDDMDMAIQHAAHPVLHSMIFPPSFASYNTLLL